MKGVALSALAAAGVVSASPTVTEKEPPTKRQNSVPTVTTSGNAFWAGSNRFYIRGIDYQPGGASGETDPLADPKICKRDIKYFKDLGVNTVRVYMVDNSKSHYECMQALADAGIYLVLDVNTPDYSLNRLKCSTSYNTKYLESIFATVQMFAQYPNTLAFFSGNEVISDKAGTELCAPYVKAVTRDIKNYMNSRGLRKVPVGYSTADVASNRMQTAAYMNCGSDDARSDFFAFNDYSWCNSNYQESGWDQKVKNFTGYGIPIFLSEWGCNTMNPSENRKFDEMAAMMKEMTPVYSGGLMYEYSKEANDYGIVEIKGDSVSTMPEFDIFKSVLADNPAPSGSGGANTTSAAVACPPWGPGWAVDPSLIPVMPSQAQKFMQNGVKTPGPGFGRPGSQDAADSGTSTANTTGGQPSPTGSGGSNKDNAAASVYGTVGNAPFIVSALALFSTLAGALLL